jgi:hypothetical protein
MKTIQYPHVVHWYHSIENNDIRPFLLKYGLNLCPYCGDYPGHLQIITYADADLPGKVTRVIKCLCGAMTEPCELLEDALCEWDSGRIKQYA